MMFLSAKLLRRFFLGQLYCVKEVMLDYLAPFIPDILFHWILAGAALEYMHIFQNENLYKYFEFKQIILNLGQNMTDEGSLM